MLRNPFSYGNAIMQIHFPDGHKMDIPRAAMCQKARYVMRDIPDDEIDAVKDEFIRKHNITKYHMFRQKNVVVLYGLRKLSVMELIVCQEKGKK